MPNNVINNAVKKFEATIVINATTTKKSKKIFDDLPNIFSLYKKRDC